MVVIGIGKLAKAAEVRTDTVRYYERLGLLAPPSRTRAGYRSYGTADIERLRFIRRAKSLGFPLDDIRQLLALRADDNARAAAVLTVTRARIAALDTQIRDLHAIAEALSRLADDCPPDAAVSECPILAHLSGLHRHPADSDRR
ncbi:MAG: heavy metal-responsive transcriptional regulator [Beijerinckiaceae bacterium]|jgi:DNA-binding transcriptional MerR regulator|nr:heavy metal-responsive transcriptional regulator [Beijerinckiaceae bacterium]